MSQCVMSEEIGASLCQCEPLDNSFQGGREMFKTHSWRTASLVMALTAIVGLALPALGGDWRPFRGHVHEMLTGAAPVDDDCLNSCQVTAVGAGQATHLGRFTRLSCVVVHEDGSPEGTHGVYRCQWRYTLAEVKGDHGLSRPDDRTWHLHVHRGDRPVQRRVGKGVFCGSYYVR